MGRKKNDGQDGTDDSAGGFGGWLKSFSGIMSSLAALVTAVVTIFAAYQTTRVHAQSKTIAQQQQQLHKLKTSPTPTVTVTAPPSGQGSPGGTTGGATQAQNGYLSALQPTVGFGEPNAGPQTMSSKAYPNSVTFSCDGTVDGDRPDVAYDIAGSHTFTAIVGIPDNTQDVTGVDETVIIANQSGTQLIKPFVVALGKPARVQVDVSNVTQLEVTCTGVDVHTHQNANGNPLTLGNAGVS